ncbi:hypothetical protein MA16_Dca022465 [Dendrobium catenatum]|uniref:Uncharacterized protein n=1 Tax=Dendrobium catenatum TaxID=906689 RepID=A0A2I0VZ15_9ASPA|nr:hypothetical protein MA16_Dca022465 [Dendrobium catenatum]
MLLHRRSNILRTSFACSTSMTRTWPGLDLSSCWASILIVVVAAGRGDLLSLAFLLAGERMLARIYSFIFLKLLEGLWSYISWIQSVDPIIVLDHGLLA